MGKIATLLQQRSDARALRKSASMNDAAQRLAGSLLSRALRGYPKTNWASLVNEERSSTSGGRTSVFTFKLNNQVSLIARRFDSNSGWSSSGSDFQFSIDGQKLYFDKLSVEDQKHVLVLLRDTKKESDLEVAKAEALEKEAKLKAGREILSRPSRLS